MVFSSLLTFGPSDTLDLFGVCADVIDDGALEVREFQVPTFLHNIEDFFLILFDLLK